MTSRSQLGWWVYGPEWDRFVSHVEEKWGEAGPYIRFELESAMREFLDQDSDLAEAESLLREYMDRQGLSSSTDSFPSDLGGDDKTKLGHRINSDLKAEFKKVAKKLYDGSLGAVLSRALNAYRDGGRARRIRENVETLITGGTSSGSTDSSDENAASSDDARGTTGVVDESKSPADESTGQSSGTSSGSTDQSDESVTVRPQVVMEIGDQLGDSFPKQQLEKDIATTVNGKRETIEAYREPILDYCNMVEHPHKDGFYITEEKREQATFWCDLQRETRAARLRRLAVQDALDKNKQRHGVKYKRVQKLFKWDLMAGPSHDYAYTLMEDAAALDGFDYTMHNGNYQLRVNIADVADGVMDDVLEEWGEDIDLGGLTVNSRIDSYVTSHSSQQEAALDDD